MIVEIHGAGFRNKGAEMMLRTVTNELRTKLPGFVPAIDPSYGLFEQRVALGLRQMFPQRTHVGSRRFSWHFKHQRIMSFLPTTTLFRAVSGSRLSNYGCVSLSEVQGFIDIAGFAYTSHWGDKPAQDLAQLTSYYKKHEIPIILMPQAFGPFESNAIRSAFRDVIENSSLIYARDVESLNYLQELSPNVDKFRQAPDITLFFPKKADHRSTSGKAAVGLIPNARMLDQGKGVWGDVYFSILVAIIAHLLDRKITVEILIHDITGQDRQLAEELLERSGFPQLPIIIVVDPIAVKERISNYEFVVGSRYHSLVAALSTEVPVIALGWAHKYALLMDEFGLSEFLVLPETSVEMAVDRVEKLLHKSTNEAYREQISVYLKRMSSANQEMWDSVVKALSKT